MSSVKTWCTKNINSVEHIWMLLCIDKDKIVFYYCEYCNEKLIVKPQLPLNKLS